MWKTGHSFIKGKIRETGAALGGEMSGHLFFKERWYGFDDAIYAAARLCELLSRHSESPSEVFSQIPDTVNTPELRLEMNEGEHHQLIFELVAQGKFEGGQTCNVERMVLEICNKEVGPSACLLETVFVSEIAGAGVVDRFACFDEFNNSVNSFCHHCS